MERERRFVGNDIANVELREQEGTAHIAGYAAVYYDGTPGTEYQLREGVVERIVPGAFNRAVAQDDVRGLFNHDANLVLGRTSAGTMTLLSDHRGLRYEITPPDTTIGRDVREMLRRRDVTGSSFSFIVTDEQWLKADGKRVREIRGVKLYDVGPVTFPAYEGTSASARSALDKLKEIEAQEAAEAQAALAARLTQYRIRARLVEIDQDER